MDTEDDVRGAGRSGRDRPISARRLPGRAPGPVARARRRLPRRAGRPGRRSWAGARPARRQRRLHRPGTDRRPAAATAADRADLIRKFGDFTDASPALLRAAMSARLHAVLDALMGQGRVLLQEMALVKPPKVSGEKPWHQDAAYFRGSDPNLMFGVWIALDPATRENGCMEVIPGSHLPRARPARAGRRHQPLHHQARSGPAGRSPSPCRWIRAMRWSSTA